MKTQNATVDGIGKDRPDWTQARRAEYARRRAVRFYRRFAIVPNKKGVK